MNRPPLEVADLVRAAGRAFIERSRRWITWQHLTVLRAIARCRTAALGGHLDECIDCGYRPAISYNSCRNRHCPKCQANGKRSSNAPVRGASSPASSMESKSFDWSDAPKLRANSRIWQGYKGYRRSLRRQTAPFRRSMFSPHS